MLCDCFKRQSYFVSYFGFFQQPSINNAQSHCLNVQILRLRCLVKCVTFWIKWERLSQDYFVYFLGKTPLANILTSLLLFSITDCCAILNNNLLAQCYKVINCNIISVMFKWAWHEKHVQFWNNLSKSMNNFLKRKLSCFLPLWRPLLINKLHLQVEPKYA